MANVGPEHLKYAWNRGEGFKRKYLAFREKHGERIKRTVGTAVRTLEVSAAGMAGGMVQGHAGEEGSSVMGIPTDLLAGLVLNGLGFAGVAGDHSDHLHNFGDGFLAAFTSSLGYGWGANWKKTGKFSFHKDGGGLGLPPGTTTKGEISPHQMADIVARVKAASGGM